MWSYAEIFFLPFNLLAASTFLPPAVFILCLKPCTLACCLFLGWKVIFMDIHLEDDLCFKIFSECTVESPVIFTTAYNQYAIEAFNANGIAYLLKPYTNDDLKAALDKFVRLLAASQRNAIQHSIAAFLNVPKRPKRMSFRVGDSYVSLTANDIAYLGAEEHYTTITTFAGKQVIINPTMTEMETHLDSDTFFRISRSYIVNIDAIEKVVHHFNGRLKLTVKPNIGHDLFVSRQRVKDFLEWFGVI